MANKKWSQFDQASSLSDTDEGVGLVSSTNKRFTFATLRTLINTGLQTIIGNITHTGDQTTSGKITAGSFEGNGALLTGVTAAGTGGSSSTGSLTVQCNSDNSTPAAKIVFSKYTTNLADLDENSFAPKTGIPYSHADDAIPFDKSIDLSGNELIRNKTILDLQPFPSYWFNGTTDYLSHADDINLNFGTDDFSILIGFKVPVSGYSSTVVLIDKKSGSNPGYNVLFTSDNRLNFVVFTDADYTIVSDNALNDGDWHVAAITADRDGVISMYIDGVIQADTESITNDTCSNILALYLGNNDGTQLYYEGGASLLTFFNRLLTDDEAVSFSSNPLKALEYADIGASNTAVYGSDFSSGTDGWSGIQVTLAGNQDGVSGRDNCLMATLNATTGQHYFNITAPWMSKSKHARFKISIYIPSGQTCDGFAIAYSAGGNRWLTGYSYVGGDGIGNNGAWVDINVDMDVVADVTGMIVYLMDGTSLNINGSGDVAYIRAVEATQIGATAVYLPQDFTADYAKDSSGNGNHLTNNGAELVNASEQLTEVPGTFTISNGDFGTWTSPTFSAVSKKQGGRVDIEITQTGGTIDPGATGKYFSGAPYTPNAKSTGSVSNASYADLGVVTLTTDGYFYFSNDFGAETGLTLSLTYFTED